MNRKFFETVGNMKHVKHLEEGFNIDFNLMFTKSTSIHREMAKRPIFIITGNFQKTRLFNIPIKPPNLQNFKCLLFFLFASSRKNIFKLKFGQKRL